MDKIIPNYRPIKSFNELIRFSTEGQLQVYHLDFFHLNQEWKIEKLTWIELENFIENHRKNFLRVDLDSPFEPIPNFIHGTQPVRESDKAKRLHNASAVMEFLIQKGGVFIMLPVQTRKEAENE